MKGVFFTVGLLLVGIVVLSASFLVYQSRSIQMSNEARAIISVKMADEAAFIGSGFRDIMDASMNVTVAGNVVSFSEGLPNQRASAFILGAASWENFTESISDFSLDINTTDARFTMPLVIQPDKATYTHPDGFGKGSVKVTNGRNVTSYDLDLTMPVTDAASLSWTALNPGSSIQFTIRVHAGNELYLPPQGLNAGLQSTLQIIQALQTITIQIGSPTDAGMLLVSNPQLIPSSLVTNVTLNASDMLTVTLPDQSINIKDNQYNISRISAVRVD